MLISFNLKNIGLNKKVLVKGVKIVLNIEIQYWILYIQILVGVFKSVDVEKKLVKIDNVIGSDFML